MMNERKCIRCSGSLEGYRSNRKICTSCTPAHRSPEARNAEYLRLRKERHCSRCGVQIEHNHRRLCDPCRSTPSPRCKKCKQVRPLSAFSRDSSRPSGYFPWCMDCSSESTSQGRFQDPEGPLNGHICPLCDTPIRGNGNRRFDSAGCKDRVKTLKSKYNLEVSEYRALVEATGGRCPICTNRPTQWHVDHDHKTLRVTGVVCQACNVGSLAMTYHDIEYVRRLLAYLENTPADQLGIEATAPEGSSRPSNLHKKWGFRGKRPA